MSPTGRDPTNPRIRLLPRGDEDGYEVQPVSLEEKVDACRDDIRGIAQDFALLRGICESTGARASAACKEAAQAKGVAADVRDIVRGNSADIGELAEHLIETQLQVGQAPHPETLRDSIQRDMTQAQLDAHDKAARLGTGLHRRVSDLGIRLGKLDRRVAFAAAIGGTVPQLVVHAPTIIEALGRLFGG